MPGGTLKTDTGEILIRTTGQIYSGEEFADIVVLTNPDGTRVTLGEMATIRDTFQEGDLKAAFNGQQAVMVNVSQVGDEDLIQIAELAKNVVTDFESTLPDGVSTNIWIDTSLELGERMSVLGKNLFQGLIFVLVILALFHKFDWLSGCSWNTGITGTLGSCPSAI